MLEKDMETAVANCPDLFIEPGLKLIRRQVVINGRRPDVLFSDSLSRHLLVEIQRGRLDEQHLQRHFYYYYDYRAKYPETHPRLLFIANRIVHQHKQFLDDNGYESREYPESEFSRKVTECLGDRSAAPQLEIELRESPGALPARFHELAYEIDGQPMALCYKMLLLIEMADLADANGSVPLAVLAERFSTFFKQRSLAGRTEENPKRFKGRLPSERTFTEWKRIIRDQPVRYLTDRFVLDEGESIRWAPRIWAQWNTAGFKEQIRAAAWDRLVRYFARHVPGGF
jgi:hypothetical protein